MFETVHLHARTEADGSLHLDLSPSLPPECEVDVVVSVRSKTEYDEAAWQAHIDSVVGSLPNIERPVQPPLCEIGPL